MLYFFLEENIVSDSVGYVAEIINTTTSITELNIGLTLNQIVSVCDTLKY